MHCGFRVRLEARGLLSGTDPSPVHATVSGGYRSDSGGKGRGWLALGLPLDPVAQRLRDAELLLADHGGPEDVTVHGVSQDSRQVSSGDLFLAWKGVDHDAHDYCRPRPWRPEPWRRSWRGSLRDLAVTQLQVSNGRLAGALAADMVFGSPWTELFLAGVTGTNGKTTVAVLARHLLGQHGSDQGSGDAGPGGRAGHGSAWHRRPHDPGPGPDLHLAPGDGG